MGGLGTSSSLPTCGGGDEVLSAISLFAFEVEDEGWGPMEVGQEAGVTVMDASRVSAVEGVEGPGSVSVTRAGD